MFLFPFFVSFAYCCGPNIPSYEIARLQAKSNFDQARELQRKQRLRKMQAVFDEKIDPSLADEEEIRLHPVEGRNDRPKCQQCVALDPSSLLWDCPILIKELQCQPYVIEYRGDDCLVANVTCPQLQLPTEDLATYLGVVAFDSTNRKRALHILQYGPDVANEGAFKVEKVHNGHRIEAQLVCNDYRRWTVNANDRKYIVDSLFCLPLRADQLDTVRDLFPV